MSTELLAIDEEVFKVIANKKRLEVILLLENRELNVGQMIDMLGLRQANLSQHLTLLRQQRLVTVRKDGKESYYKLADNSIAKSIRIIHDFLRKQHRIEMPIDSKTLFPIVTDPICGMRFSASQALDHVIDENNKTYYFCASGCKERFAKDKL
ncbi:MAG: metalloregulator ArsR/SmtB family transcription factor [Ignavibacteria bacterium]|nr:metalloregulator ArsR/SmtB family transcription factor [Ignavibacteria bacterium]